MAGRRVDFVADDVVLRCPASIVFGVLNQNPSAWLGSFFRISCELGDRAVSGRTIVGSRRVEVSVAPDTSSPYELSLRARTSGFTNVFTRFDGKLDVIPRRRGMWRIQISGYATAAPGSDRGSALRAAGLVIGGVLANVAAALQELAGHPDRVWRPGPGGTAATRQKASPEA